MRGWYWLMLLFGLAACGNDAGKAPEVQEQQTIDRSVADVAAAEAASQGPIPPPMPLPSEKEDSASGVKEKP